MMCVLSSCCHCNFFLLPAAAAEKFSPTSERDEDGLTIRLMSRNTAATVFCGMYVLDLRDYLEKKDCCAYSVVKIQRRNLRFV